MKIGGHGPLPCEKAGGVGVESGCGAVMGGSAYLLPPLSSGGASLAEPSLRFHISLIEPSVRVSRTRLSDKTSCLRPRKALRPLRQVYQPQTLVQVWRRVAFSPPAPHLMLDAEPPA